MAVSKLLTWGGVLSVFFKYRLERNAWPEVPWHWPTATSQYSALLTRYSEKSWVVFRLFALFRATGPTATGMEPPEVPEDLTTLIIDMVLLLFRSA